ncbi:neuronal PAS domain-containing protein 4-like [Lampris incognitus]|uniref:neuronal PAS domain-containing protein 4-like n=1 Tax=Lampris incognitus TaxID=2546036 RepID=UPI0024B4A44C|nr:neuronal PAS domain-containing protein 4-like [Lampris incognitus]
MTTRCECCQRRARAPAPPRHPAPESPRGARKRFRSTKGASKARRDHINSEIRSMRTLLPIPEEDQERLSYLHSMAAICTYIRKLVFFQGFPAGQGSDCPVPYEAFLHALHGFILVTTTRGRLVYVSENVADYLGYSLVDVLQGDTFYDMVGRPDVDMVKSRLEGDNGSSAESSFVCCMQTSKAFRLQHGRYCSVLVQGSFQPLLQSSAACPVEERLFVALCSPTVDRLWSAELAHLPTSFGSGHRPDMTFTRVSDSVLHVLGYSAEEMVHQSWYGLLHPEDLLLSAAPHKSLIQADGGSQVEMVSRLQCKDSSWAWVYMRATKDSDCQGISSINCVLTETEARFLMEKIKSNAFPPAPQAHPCHSSSPQMPQIQGLHFSGCFKRQRRPGSQSEEPCAKTRRESDRDVYDVACASCRVDGSPVTMGDSPAPFTPPYSPASSGSPPQMEEGGADCLMDLPGYTDGRLLSSPEGSPSYYPYAEVGPVSHLSPSLPLRAASEEGFDLGAIGAVSAPSPDLPSFSPTCDFQARVVPDRLSASDVCESPADGAPGPESFGHLEPLQAGSLFEAHQVARGMFSPRPGLLTPHPSPTSQDSFQYDDREQVEISILAQQISSLASSFDRYRARDPVQNGARTSPESLPFLCRWPQRPPLAAKPELDADDGMFDSLLRDVNTVTGKCSVFGPGVIPDGYQQGAPVYGRTPHHRPGQELSGPSLSDLLCPDDSAAEPVSWRPGSHERDAGLHQLGHHLHISLQQDGLAEETVY